MDISSNNLTEHEIISSYINFINTSNQSIHSMIDVINEQQSSFNTIISRYTSPARIIPPNYSRSSRNNSHNRSNHNRNTNRNNLLRNSFTPLNI